MIDHISIPVTSLARSVAFYDEVLGSLGYRRLWSTADGAGYGGGGFEEAFAIFERPGQGMSGFHVAFSARSAEKVDGFHAAGLRLCAVDAGAPGLRPQYGPEYYAAFILDPDGYKLEAVFKDPVKLAARQPLSF